MDRWNHMVIRDLLYDCAAVAMKGYENRRWRLKRDKSLVTDADLAIERLLAEDFDKPQEGTYLIGEETLASRDEEYVESAFSGTAWVVDPIDGTSPYANHVPFWGISIGLMERGVLSEGAIYLPISGEMFVTCEGEVLHLCAPFANGRARNEKDFKRLNPPRTRLSPGGIVAVGQNIAKHGGLDLPNTVNCACSMVYVCMGLLLGRYMAFAGFTKLWDMGGSLPLLWNCGFKGRLADGRPIIRDIRRSGCFRLESSDPRCWYFKEQAIIAKNDNIIRKVCGAIH